LSNFCVTETVTINNCQVEGGLVTSELILKLSTLRNTELKQTHNSQYNYELTRKL